MPTDLPVPQADAKAVADLAAARGEHDAATQALADAWLDFPDAKTLRELRELVPTEPKLRDAFARAYEATVALVSVEDRLIEGGMMAETERSIARDAGDDLLIPEVRAENV